MNSQPRVLALADHLGHADGRVHGATTYYLQVFPALQRAGVALTVAFLAGPHSAARELREQGIEPVFFDASKWNFAVYGRLLGLIDRDRIQVLHLAAFKSQFLGRLAAKRRGCRAIVHLHDTVALRPHVKVMQRLVRNSTDLALAVSAPVWELGVHDYGLEPRIVRTLHNAVDLQRFQVERTPARADLMAALRLDEPARLIGMIGRLAPMKGHRYMLDALPHVLRHCPSARLLVIGEGPMRSAWPLPWSSASSRHFAGGCC